MARTINKVELLGRVGTDPEMKYTPNGTAVTQLRLATDRYRRDGEDTADWHNIVVWGKSGEAVNQYVQKGQRIYVARTPRPEQLGGRGRPAPPPHRGPHAGGRLPRLQRQRERGERRRRGGLPLLARPAHNLVRRPPFRAGRTTTGPLPIHGGGPALVRNRNPRRPT